MFYGPDHILKYDYQLSDEKRRKSSIEKREDMMIFALNHFKQQLGLESEASLEGKIEIREIPDGYRIMEEDSLKDAALVLVIQANFTFNFSPFKDFLY